MSKIVKKVINTLLVCTMLSACHSTISNSTTTAYNTDMYVIIKLPTEEIVEGYAQVNTYTHDDMVKVVYSDGVEYYVHSNNVAIIREPIVEE